jgi:hypothetical protein
MGLRKLAPSAIMKKTSKDTRNKKLNLICIYKAREIITILTILISLRIPLIELWGNLAILRTITFWQVDLLTLLTTLIMVKV